MAGRKRILVLGATGMLGHKLAQVLGESAEVIAGIRGSAGTWPASIPVTDVAEGVDVRDTSALARLLDSSKPDIVLNAVGVVKQILGEYDSLDTVAINALYPNLLALLCETRGIRLVHYSTDCVFTGIEDGQRGENGYREADRADSRDLYGMSKLLGEPRASTTLTLRTSMIGRELRGFTSLVEWFLAQGEGIVKGYTKALFTGLTTLELARVTAMVLRDHPQMTGLWHVAAPPVNKYDLLTIVKASYGRATTVERYDDFYCDRRLDGTRFQQATGWQSPPWPKLIDDMRNDPLDYEALRERKSA
jgi:dTDP-4-dehydrorhamnose reductase